MIYVGLVLLPGLPAVKRPNGCRLNGVGAMGKGRISERSEWEIICVLSPLLREVKLDFHWETETPVLSLWKSF